MQLHITQGRTKALRQPGDTMATPAHTRNHNGMHANICWRHTSVLWSPSHNKCCFELLLHYHALLCSTGENVHIHRYADETHVYLTSCATQRWDHDIPPVLINQQLISMSSPGWKWVPKWKLCRLWGHSLAVCWKYKLKIEAQLLFWRGASSVSSLHHILSSFTTAQRVVCKCLQSVCANYKRLQQSDSN